MSLIRVKDLHKSFGGLHVLEGLNLDMERGQILSLIGPNGAGKTTLFNIISGIYPPDSGSVEFDSKEITGLKPHQICKLGIARTFQIAEPIVNMTTRENVAAALLHGRENLTSLKEAEDEAYKILKFIGLIDKSDVPVESLNVNDKRRLELGRALACKPIVMLCDEVIAGLTPTETKRAVQLLRRIRDELNVSLFLVEHVMRAVMDISDEVCVLNQGKIICRGKPKEVVKDKRVIEAYLGESVDA